MPREVERKIKFYRFDLGKNAQRLPIQLNLRSLFTHLHGLDDAGRSFEIEADEVTYLCYVDRHNRSPYHAKFVKVKRRDVPQIYDQRNRAHDLNDGEGIGDAVHAIFFPDNVIAIEANKNGPSAYAICSHLQEIAPQHCPNNMRCVQLVWGDIASRLRKLDTLLSITLKVRQGFSAHHADIYNGVGNIQQALNGLENINNVGDTAFSSKRLFLKRSISKVEI
jgi:hypothetical protein